MNSAVDMHMHSTASDGSDRVPELVRKIQQLGITTFALTDHDTIRGALEMEKLVPDGIRFIRGIEFSCKTEVAKCHILGYNYDPEQAGFPDFVAEAYAVRIHKTHNRLSYLEKEYGFVFTDGEKEEQLKNPGKLQLKKLLFLCVWACLFYMAVKLVKKARFLWVKAFSAGYLLMCLGIIVGGIGDHVLFNVRLGVLFWLLNTLLVLIWNFNRFASE